MGVEVDELEEDLDDQFPALKVSWMLEGKLEEELVDKNKNRDTYEVFRIALYPNTVLNEMWF